MSLWLLSSQRLRSFKTLVRPYCLCSTRPLAARLPQALTWSRLLLVLWPHPVVLLLPQPDPATQASSLFLRQLGCLLLRGFALLWPGPGSRGSGVPSLQRCLPWSPCYNAHARAPGSVPVLLFSSEHMSSLCILYLLCCLYVFNGCLLEWTFYELGEDVIYYVFWVTLRMKWSLWIVTPNNYCRQTGMWSPWSWGLFLTWKCCHCLGFFTPMFRQISWPTFLRVSELAVTSCFPR